MFASFPPVPERKTTPPILIKANSAEALSFELLADIAVLKEKYPELSFDSCTGGSAAFLREVEANSHHILEIAGRSKEFLDTAIRFREQGSKEIEDLKRAYEANSDAIGYFQEREGILNRLIIERDKELENIERVEGRGPLTKERHQKQAASCYENDPEKQRLLLEEIGKLESQLDVLDDKYNHCLRKYNKAVKDVNAERKFNLGLYKVAGTLKELMLMQQVALQRFKVGVLLCPTRSLIWQISNHYYFNMLNENEVGKQMNKAIADRYLAVGSALKVPYMDDFRNWLQERSLVSDSSSSNLASYRPR